MNYLGKLNLRAFRYCVLVAFLACNALIASIALWNLGIIQETEGSRSSVRSIDSYLAFLGASGLVILFTVAFIELARIPWFIATVWFECTWISLWGLMYFAAAIALTVITSQEDCTTTDQTPKCVSLQVLLAFTWLCALTLIIYLSTFMFAVFINKKKDPTVWHSMMRKFPWAGTCTILASAPPTPTLPRFVQNTTVPIIHAPKPKHARTTAVKRPPVFSWRSGLSHEYHIEHYQPPASSQAGPPSHDPHHAPSRSVELPPSAAPPVISAPVLPPIAEPESSENNFGPSLYPMYMRQAIFNANTPETTRPEPALTHATIGAATRVARAPLHSALPPSPPPLGNWPRSDIISQPVKKGKRKPPPISTRGDFDSDNSEAGSYRVLAGSSQREREVHQPIAPSSFQPMRPSGPRRRSGSSDLSNRYPARDRQKVEYA